MNRKVIDKVFSLAQNEEYSERCGEVFLTNIGNLVFHCTLCDMKCKGFEKYANHTRDEHLLSSSPHYDYFNVDASNLNYDCEYDHSVIKEQEEEVVLYEDEAETHFDIEIVRNKDDSTMENGLQVDVENEIEIYSQDDSDDYEYSPDDPAEVRHFQSVNDEPEAKLNANESKNAQSKVRNLRKTNPLLDVIQPTEEIRTIRTPSQSSVFDANRKYKCPLCSAAFKDKNNLKHHIRRHSNVKNHACEHCEKKFYTRAELKVHLRSHTQEKPFLCCECGLRFATNVIFTMHMKRHRNERDIQCPHCDAKFFHKERLKTHLALHNNELPHICEVCKCRFNKRRNLLRHMHVHKKIGDETDEIVSIE